MASHLDGNGRVFSTSFQINTRDLSRAGGFPASPDVSRLITRLSALSAKLKEMPFASRSKLLDRVSRKFYSARREELAARGFEAWIRDSLTSAGRRNDFLLKFQDEAEFSMSFPEKYRGRSTRIGDTWRSAMIGAPKSSS